MSEKIVITDGFTLEPDESAWSTFEKFGTVDYHQRTLPNQMSARCADATIIITNKTPIDADTINACPTLKLIAVTATGYNIIDIKAAREKDINVCNVPGYGTESVAQHTISLLLELSNHVGLNSSAVAAGEWERSPDFCFSRKQIFELKDKTIGIVGYGHIGRKVGEIAQALGMKIMFFSPSQRSQNGTSTIDEIFSLSDVVSLHCPLTSTNREFVDAKLLGKMKPSALLINTARGQLVNESDLADALLNGVIAGAALDVLSVEPPPSNHPLLRIPNCIITPHTAWFSTEARRRIMKTTIDNVTAALLGNPINVVNKL